MNVKNWEEKEIARHANEPCEVIWQDDGPPLCPRCGSEVDVFGGMVGEDHMVCTGKDCTWSWTDHEDAIRRVI